MAKLVEHRSQSITPWKMRPATTAANLYTATPYCSPTPQCKPPPRPCASRRRKHSNDKHTCPSRWHDSASNSAAFVVCGIVLLLGYAPPHRGATAVASAASVARTSAGARGRCGHSSSSRLLTTMGETATTVRPSPDIAHVRPADNGRRVVRLTDSVGASVTGMKGSRAAARADEEGVNGAGVEWSLAYVPDVEDGSSGSGRYVSPMQTLRNVSFLELRAMVTHWICHESTDSNRLDTPKRGDSVSRLSIPNFTGAALLATVSSGGTLLTVSC